MLDSTFRFAQLAEDPLVVKIAESLRQAEVSAAIVALSGGPDSTALLIALVALRQLLSFRLLACHVNHHLRGLEADNEEDFCKRLCQVLSVTLVVKHLSHPLKSEAQLREARYGLLAACAAEHEASSLILGHTLDDQVETMLFRLFRGTGPGGLMAMLNNISLDTGPTKIRPMLAIRKSQCVAFLQKLGVKACADSSNYNLNYNRNYIRHKLVPLIKERFPRFIQSMEELGQLIAEDEEVMAELVKKSLQEIRVESAKGQEKWQIAAFSLLPCALKRRLLVHALQERSVAVSFERIGKLLNMIEAFCDTAISLDKRFEMQIKNAHVLWVDKQLSRKPYFASAERELLAVPGLTICYRLGYVVKIEDFSESFAGTFPEASSWEALVDLSCAQLPLVLRTRQPADVIRPFGMTNLVRLKKYLHTHKFVPILTKDGQELLIADQAEVIWIPGVGISNKIRVGQESVSKSKPTHKLKILVLGSDEMSIC